jgi:hypothetical protein
VEGEGARDAGDGVVVDALDVAVARDELLDPVARDLLRLVAEGVGPRVREEGLTAGVELDREVTEALGQVP